MRVAGILLLALLAAPARGADPPPAASDSISDAKKDFAAIKAPSSQTEAGALPAMDMKDLGPVPGAATAEPSLLLNPEKDPSLDPTKKKTGTGNWLVDAMDKNTSTQGSRSKEKDEILKGDPDLIKADEKGVRLERDPLALDDARDRERPKGPAEPVYNPLDAFMSGWVSARDHDLLLTSTKGEGLAGADLGKVHADALPGADAGQPGALSDLLAAPMDPTALGDSRGSNPYLGSLDLIPAAPMKSFAAPDGAAFNPTGFQDAPRGMSSAGVDPKPIDISRNFIPDFAQPADDDKYFKQLKKF
jgi:hypothetical protein